MVGATPQFLDLMTGSVLVALWAGLGLAACLWLALLGGLLRDAAVLCLRRPHHSAGFSAADLQFLRSLHIRL
ncbi:MAG: hypothetical protein HXY18_06160 [Bryobacteraceae bacterium]|nr:hypothetical protein [Bryobacteraceae bacterium]